MRGFSRFEGETEVDAIGREHRQVQGGEAGVFLQLVKDLLQVLAMGPGEHEPQVVMMLAGVVVIDLRVLADPRGHLFQALDRHRQGGQGAGARAGVFEHRADARQRPGQFQALQAGHHLGLVAAQHLGHFAVGFGAQRHAVLEAFNQLLAERIKVHFNTPFFARAG